MMEIQEEIRALTQKQKDLINQSMKINKEKIERLNAAYGIYPKNYARLDKILQQYDELLGSKNNYVNDREAIGKLYKRLCQKIFSKSIKLNKKYQVEVENSYYSPTKTDNIAFTRRGLAYKPEYNHRLRTVEDIAFTIKYFNMDKSMRDLPLSKRKLAMWQKFYDAILPFNFHENKLEEAIKLKEPIRTCIEQERNYGQRDEYSYIKYRDIKEITINRIDIDINEYRRQIDFIKEHTGDAIVRINFSRGDYDETDNMYIKHIINQIPEEIFIKLEKFLIDVQTATDNNKVIYEKMKEEFGYLILSEEI